MSLVPKRVNYYGNHLRACHVLLCDLDILDYDHMSFILTRTTGLIGVYNVYSDYNENMGKHHPIFVAVMGSWFTPKWTVITGDSSQLQPCHAFLL